MVAADLKATDRNEGTKPVFKGVNPAAATTAGIFAVFKMAQHRTSGRPADSQPNSRFLACALDTLCYKVVR
jgi:hypothetical protein